MVSIMLCLSAYPFELHVKGIDCPEEIPQDSISAVGVNVGVGSERKYL